MNILLTGGSGFLGRYIHRCLISSSSVTTLGRTCCNIISDISVSAPDLTEANQIDAVIHVAGKAHLVPRTSEKKQLFWKVNFEGTKNLCKAIELLDKPPLNFTYISTVSVYGIETGENISEEHSLNGKSDYALSKIEAETWLSDWARKKCIKLVILRLPLVVGVHPPGNLGSMIAHIAQGRYFRVGKGDARKSMVLAADVGQFIEKVIGKEGIFNLTDGYHPSFFEIEDVISSQLGKNMSHSIPLPLARLLAKIGDYTGDYFPINSSLLSKIISTLTFSDERARNMLGWKPRKVIDDFKIKEV